VEPAGRREEGDGRAAARHAHLEAVPAHRRDPREQLGGRLEREGLAVEPAARDVAVARARREHDDPLAPAREREACADGRAPCAVRVGVQPNPCAAAADDDLIEEGDRLVALADAMCALGRLGPPRRMPHLRAEERAPERAAGGLGGLERAPRLSPRRHGQVRLADVHLGVTVAPGDKVGAERVS